MQIPFTPKLQVTAAIAALWLSACGGGGGDDNLLIAPSPGIPMAAAVSFSASTAPTWTVAIATPRIWHSLSTNEAGNVLAAGEAGGPIRVSSDGGTTWTAGNSSSAIWISSAMSASGDQIFAVQFGGAMYRSIDRGATWTAVTNSPLVYDAAAGLGYEAVTVSRDGMHIAAVIQNGAIVISNDGGATWRTGTLPDAPQIRWWRWIHSSSDGRVLVAVSHNGEVYRSADFGATWGAVTVAVGTPAAAVFESWYRVRLSADGQTIALAANSFGGAPGTGIYVSHDSGATWTKGFNLVADYTALTMSADGRTIGATVSNTGSTAGRVLLSTDSGATFTALATPGTETNWRTMAMSADAARMAIAAGGFNTQQAGLLYTAAAGSAPAPAPSPAPSPAPAPSPTPPPSPAPSPAPAPACNPAAWVSTIRYMPGDMVLHNGVTYVAAPISSSVWNVGSPPEWTPNYWTVTGCGTAPVPAPAPTPAPPAPTPSPPPPPPPAPAPTPAPTPAPSPAPACSAATWINTTRYMPGDRVLRNGTLYEATPLSASVWNVGSPPEWTPNYWARVSC